MEITQSVLPNIVSQANNLEEVFYFFCKYLHDKQVAYNKTLPEDAQVTLFDRTFTTEEGQDLFTFTVTSLEIQLEESTGRLIPVPAEFDFSDYIAGTVYPWNEADPLACFYPLWMIYLNIEKQVVYNPDNNEPIQMTLTSDTGFNTPLFSFEGTAILPVEDASNGSNVGFQVVPYLIGESLW